MSKFLMRFFAALSAFAATALFVATPLKAEDIEEGYRYEYKQEGYVTPGLGLKAPLNLGSATIPTDKLYKEGVYVGWFKAPPNVGAGGLNVVYCETSPTSDGKKLLFDVPVYGNMDLQVVNDEKTRKMMLFLFETIDKNNKNLTFYCLDVKPKLSTRESGMIKVLVTGFKKREINIGGILALDVTGVEKKTVPYEGESATQQAIKELLQSRIEIKDNDDARLLNYFYFIIDEMTKTDSEIQKTP